MDPRTSLKSAYDLFILDGQARRFTVHTLRFYHGRLSLFLRWCHGENIVYLIDLSPQHIRRYLVELGQTGVSSAYHHSLARAIRAFLNYCVRDELLALSPFAKVQMPRLEKRIPPAISAADITRILRACSSERDRALIMFALDSGVRASEICALTIADVSLETGAVRVRLGKGQKDRTTYIGVKTRKQLLRYFARERNGQPGQDEPLFARRGATITSIAYDGLKQLIRRLCNASGVHFSAHSLRRTFALNSLRNGMNIYVLARLMGHTDITVLRVYLELLEVDLATAHQRSGVVDNL